MKTTPTRNRYRILLSVVFLAIVLMAGCSKPKGSISGKVIYGKDPLKGGFLTFTPEKGPPVHAKIESNGEYHVNNVPVGEVKITVQGETATGADFVNKAGPPMPKSPEEMKQMMMPKNEVKIPTKYSDPAKSDLTYTVVEGPQEHDIMLKYEEGSPSIGQSKAKRFQKR